MIKNPLTESRKKMIKTWLNNSYEDKSHYCPFIRDVRRRKRSYGSWRDWKYCNDVCQVLFPKTKIVYDEKCIVCPCDSTSVKYVTRKAKEFLKR